MNSVKKFIEEEKVVREIDGIIFFMQRHCYEFITYMQKLLTLFLPKIDAKKIKQGTFMDMDTTIFFCFFRL